MGTGDIAFEVGKALGYGATAYAGWKFYDLTHPTKKKKKKKGMFKLI